MKQLNSHSADGCGCNGGKTVSVPDFGFAFDDTNFSDRILRVEIIPDVLKSKSDGEDGRSVADWASDRKRRRQEIGVNPLVEGEEQVFCNVPCSEEAFIFENVDGDAVARIEELPCVERDEAVHSSESSWSMATSSAFRVKTMHISSPILAAWSPFFYKMFSNGMSESERRHVTLRIHASEEVALMDLLKFMYTTTLSASTPTALLDVLMAADKFEVASCMKHCSSKLLEFPMTIESALLYLDLPDTPLMAEAVQPLTKAAKDFLATSVKDITKCQEEAMKLPFAGIQAVLSSDSLQVASEDVVYDFVLKWARTHYPRSSDRQKVLSEQLCGLIRFPYMTSRKLRKVLSCSDIDPKLAAKMVENALFYKAEPPYRQRALVAEQAKLGLHQYVPRSYKYRPLKVVEFELPRPQCVVYLDLTQEECKQLIHSGRIYSQAFHLGGQGFFLSAHCNPDQQTNLRCFGLFLGMQEKGSGALTIEYEFSARQMQNKEFVSKYKGKYTFTGGKAVGYRNLFGVSWDTFVAEDSIFFINGILHLRAGLTIRQ
ncbi:hypothetical protein Ancab_032758 [Ancistrocladus abbreviatus]